MIDGALHVATGEMKHEEWYATKIIHKIMSSDSIDSQ
jgi:hypothetical protein